MKKVKLFLISGLFLFLVLVFISCGTADGGSMIIDGDADNSSVDIVPVAVVSTEIKSCDVSYQYRENDNIEISVNVDNHYLFKGWYVVNGEDKLCISTDEFALIDLKRTVFKDYIVNGKIEIIACFDAALSVNYRLDGGYFEDELVTNCFDTSENDAILPYKVAREGYCFVGWRDENGEIVKRIHKGTNGEITLTAEWCDDYRKQIIGKVWSFEVPLNFPVPGAPETSNMYIEFVDDMYVKIYASTGNGHLDIGRAYIASLHNITFFAEIHNDANTGCRYQYNEWDFGELRENEISNLRYQIVDERIMIYLESDDEIYTNYINDYFCWYLYLFEYDVNSGVLTFKSQVDPFGKTGETIIYTWLDILGGDLPQTLAYVQPQFGDHADVICTDVTDTWADTYTPCNMDMGDLKNSFSINEEKSVMLITNYNSLIMPQHENVGDQNLEVYSFNYLTTARNSFIFSLIVLNNGDSFSMCYFMPLTGTVVDLTGGEDGNNIVMGIMPTDSGLKMFITNSEESGSVYDTYNKIGSANADETKVYYWMFKETIDKIKE